jgi:hypothetical protein
MDEDGGADKKSFDAQMKGVDSASMYSCGPLWAPNKIASF